MRFEAFFRSDSRALALDTRDSVQLYAFERPAAHREFAEDLGTDLDHVAFSSDGRWLAASGNWRMGVWDLTAKAFHYRLLEPFNGNLQLK